MFQQVAYCGLNARQKENYNFQKIAARLADFGFNCLRLTDDWQGADFIACHIDGETFLKVQLKPRLAIDKKYIGKELLIAFLEDENCYIYKHDALVYLVENSDSIGVKSSISWHERGIYNWPRIPKWAVEFLSEYKI